MADRWERHLTNAGMTGWVKRTSGYEMVRAMRRCGWKIGIVTMSAP